jgi:TRAP-type C4-dicarboxylate transport system permease small subunit
VNPLRKLHTRLGRVEAIIAAILLILMVLLIFAGGLARLAAHPMNWTIDFATCFFAWACFLAADVAWRRDSLMSIEVVTERLPAGARRRLLQLNYVLIGCFLIYVIYAGVLLSWLSRARAFQGIPSISYSWVTMSLPVGAALLLLTTVLKFSDSLRSEAGDRQRTVG